MYSKKLYFNNNYQRDIYIESKKQRIKNIDNKIKLLIDEKQRLLNNIKQVSDNDYNLCNELTRR